MLETIYIRGTSKTPKVILDPKRGLLEFIGRSIMENPQEFYDPLFDWVIDYVVNPKDTIVTIDFEYFNSPTNKFLQIFFTLLKDIQKKGFRLVVYWIYDKNDEDIWESGQEFSNIAAVQFYYIERTYTPLGMLEIEPTEISPRIKLDPANGLIEIAGKAIMEDIESFLHPLMDWLIKYSKEPRNTLVTVDLQRFNEKTNMFFLTFFSMLAEIKLQGFNVLIDWFYNSDDVGKWESGKAYASLSDLEFNFIERSLK
jgi:hypothetical protein